MIRELVGVWSLERWWLMLVLALLVNVLVNGWGDVVWLKLIES